MSLQNKKLNAPAILDFFEIDLHAVAYIIFN